MIPFALKSYQQAALDSLRTYLAAARILGAAPAFNGLERAGVRNPKPYQPLQGLAPIPYVCLRLPTGGGKTLLSAHTVKLAADAYLEQEAPLVLWLVPSNTIRSQTLETLRKPGNPNREALHEAFAGRVRVFDIADFAAITPADLAANACIVVATMQTLRVTNTDGRKVYAHNENLEPHFTAIPANAPNMERYEEGERAGRIKPSFRNLLARHRPLVIVDEAHNNTSGLSYEVLQRIGAACVVEFTATPADDSNILHNTSATELKAEEMIKLPIRLTEHPTWQDAVRDSLRTRQHLAGLAQADSAYIRPIILFQAEEKGREVTQDVLVNHLTENEGIARNRIAIVTGTQKELDGIDLFAPTCPIDFVITVEALKEGWDCSFAYVFCSAATVHSKKDVEQILGRVLRMPYATRRAHPDLNRAYAHVARTAWTDAVRQLHDHLVDMGFEDTEAHQVIETASLPLQGGAGSFPAAPPPTIFELSEDISALLLAPEERQSVTIERTATGSRVTFTGNVAAELVTRIAATVKAPEARAALHAHATRHRILWQQHTAPAQRGDPFRIPQLAFRFESNLEKYEIETVMEAAGWSPLEYSAALAQPEFDITEAGVVWEVDLSATGRLTERHVAPADQFDLDLVDTGWTVSHLCIWLERRLRRPDLTQTVLIEFVRRAVAHLTEHRGLPLPALVRWKFILAKALAQKLDQHRRTAAQATHQRTLFAPDAAVETSFAFAYDVRVEPYPHRSTYAGRFEFQKHYPPQIGELDNKGEEYECAQALDRHPKVRHWVRNLERRGFALPLADGNFYPDFVAELTDGRLLVVEHKGAHLLADARPKQLIGDLWAASSNGTCRFVMTVKEAGRPSLYDQIAAAIA